MHDIMLGVVVDDLYLHNCATWTIMAVSQNMLLQKGDCVVRSRIKTPSRPFELSHKFSSMSA